MRILIAEDNAIASKMLSMTLERLGHEVVAADDGETAWGFYQGEPFRVVVSDWMMPGMDGLELCTNIRNRADAGYTYFILLTAAQTSSEDYTLAMNAGVDDFLTKPLQREILRTRLHVAERILRYTTEIGHLQALIPMCGYCHKVRKDEIYWQNLETYISDSTGSKVSHGICPECYQDQIRRLRGTAI